MTQETKKMIEQEADELYPYHPTDKQQKCLYEGYISGATKYAEEVERLREALEEIMDSTEPTYKDGDVHYIAQQALFRNKYKID